MKKFLLAACAITAFSAPAMAQHDHMAMSAPPAKMAETPLAKAQAAAMDKMMKGMDVPTTGDADKDFVNGMIPHHEGAVDMAKIELQYGTDPELKKLAKDIIAAQEKEITFMKAWQKKHQ